MESVVGKTARTFAGALPCPTRLVSAFFTAIANKKVKRVAQFVLEYPDQWKTVVNEDGVNAMEYAIICNSLDVAKHFLSAGWEIESAVDEIRTTAFLFSVNRGSVKSVDFFVRKSCNIHAMNDHGNGALALACFRGHLPMVKRVTKFGFSVNETHANGYTPLHCAADRGHVETASYLIENGAKLEAMTTSGRTPFLVACSFDRVDIIDLLVSKGCNIYVKEKRGDGALAIASWNGNLRVAEKLIHLGLDPNEEEVDGYASLHWAAKNGRVKVAEFLISKGARLEGRTESGHTPFLVACDCQCVDMIDLLIAEGCDVRSKNKRGDGALAMASWKGNFVIAKKLIQLGLDINQSHFCGYTSLHWAVAKGHLKLADFLIEKGACLEAESKVAENPFLVACNSERIDLVEFLVSKNCNIHAKSEEGDGALATAISRGNLGLAEKLLQLGLDVNERLSRGFTSLHQAASKGHRVLAEFLIDHGAELEAKDENGDTPILCCIAAGDLNMLQLLLQKGCNIHAKNKIGIGALATASVSGKVEMALKLLKIECLVNETDYFGRTSLHMAAKWNRPAVADLLIDWGANVEARDKWGRTPFLHAVCNGQTADFLLSKGCNIHAFDKEKYGALALACIENHYDVAELLIAKFRNEDLNAVLHMVAQRDFDRVADLMISRGANCEVRDKWGCTPLLTAIEFGSDNVIELLLEKGCSVFALTENSESVLDVALMGGRIDLFHRFVKAGIKASQLSQESRRFLFKAAAKGSEAAAHFLKEINIIQCSENPLKWTSPQERDDLLQEIDLLHSKLAERQVRVPSQKENELRTEESFRAGTHRKGWRQEVEEVSYALSRSEGILARLRDSAREMKAVHKAKEAAYKAVITRLESKVEENNGIIQSQAHEIAQLKASAEDKEVQIERGRKETDALRHGNAKNVDLLQKRLAAAENENLQLRATAGERDLQIESARKENSEMKLEHARFVRLYRERFAVAEERHTLLETAVEEANLQIETAKKEHDSLRLEHAKLNDLYQETQAELRALIGEKAEKENLLKEARAQEEFIHIPVEDVKMTDIKLGEGGYGEVRVGYWRGCPVAVKMFYEFLNTDYHLRLFQQEITVCVRARHPNVVFLCGITTENGVPFRIITELLEGSLSDVIKAALRTKWPLSLREQIDLALGTTAGIAYLHQLGPDGVLHGDIRPSNVVITSLMEAKVCDLGAARLAEMSLSAGPLSPQYLAPERMPDKGPGASRNTKMADVCSLGVALVELMTGELSVASHRFEQAADVGHPAVKNMCRDMICVDPYARPTSAECLALLERVQESEEYHRCYPKRLVKGRLHGEDQVTLVFPMLPQRRSVKSYIS